MFERFTDEARRAVVMAQEEARELRADQIQPVHLLLALTRDAGTAGDVLRAAGVDHSAAGDVLSRSGGDLDAEALAAVGIDVESVRAAAEAAFGPGALQRGGSWRSGHIPFALGSKRALEESLRAALSRKDRRIQSRHVLAGVLVVADPTVDRLLTQLGSSADALRDQLGNASAA